MPPSIPSTIYPIACAASTVIFRHGSLGLSTNFFDTDRARQLVPSRVADDPEFEALFEVLARYPRASLQLIADSAIAFARRA